MLGDGERAEDARCLELARDAEPGDGGRCEAVKRCAGEGHAPGIEPGLAAQDPKERGLAAAIGAEQAEQPAHVELEREIAQRLDAAEALVQPFDGEQRHGLSCSRALARCGRAPPPPPGHSPSVRARNIAMVT